MDNETKERLLSDLEEAKGSFDILIEQMKRMGTPFGRVLMTYVDFQYIEHVRV